MNLLAIFDPFWPWLIAATAIVFIGSLASQDIASLQISSSMLFAYIIMQAKKEGFDFPAGHLVSLMLWGAVASYLGAFALIHRENYGISLKYAAASFMLLLCGLCYAWAYLLRVESRFLAPHALAADAFAIIALLIAGRGLGAEVGIVARNIGSSLGIGSGN